MQSSTLPAKSTHSDAYGPDDMDTCSRTMEVLPSQYERLLVYMSLDKMHASTMTTSMYASPRTFFHWRLIVLLYITWSTGLEMYAFFHHDHRFTGKSPFSS